MTEELTATELVMVSLVLGQQKDEYPEKQRKLQELSTKTRKLANDRLQGDSA